MKKLSDKRLDELIKFYMATEEESESIATELKLAREVIAFSLPSNKQEDTDRFYDAYWVYNAFGGDNDQASK